MPSPPKLETFQTYAAAGDEARVSASRSIPAERMKVFLLILLEYSRDNIGFFMGMPLEKIISFG